MVVVMSEYKFCKNWFFSTKNEWATSPGILGQSWLQQQQQIKKFIA